MARSCATNFGVVTRMKSSKIAFEVDIPDQLRISDIRKFTQIAYIFGMSPDENLLSLMAYVDRSPFSSGALAWRDPETGLAWDIARLLYGNDVSAHPASGEELMNALQYAGLSNWRLPTLDELKTISVAKLNSADATDLFSRGLDFWSTDESLYSGPEKALLNVESRLVRHQRFIEQHRDKNSDGDGYTEAAQTMMVCPILPIEVRSSFSAAPD